MPGSDIEMARRITVLEAQIAQLAALVGVSETGTYTPTYLGTTTPGVTTYTAQEGYYTRIGNIVFVNGLVVWTAASGTGNALISLPFVVDVARARATGDVRSQSVTFLNGSIQLLVSTTVAAFTLESPATNAASTNVAVEAAGNITFSLWYPI